MRVGLTVTRLNVYVEYDHPARIEVQICGMDENELDTDEVLACIDKDKIREFALMHTDLLEPMEPTT